MDSERLAADIDAVRRLARRLVDGWHEAEDVTQEACAEAIVHPAPPGVALRVWMRGIVRNVVARRLRAGARREARELRYRSDKPHTTPSTDAVVVRTAEHRRVVDAVLSLDEPYREMLLLRYFESLPPRRVAVQLGVPVETVRTRTARALEHLRRELVTRRDGDRRASWVALATLARFGSPRSTMPRIATGGAAVMSGKLVGSLMVVVVVLIVWIASRGSSEPSLVGAEPPMSDVPVRASLFLENEGAGSSGAPSASRRSPGSDASRVRGTWTGEVVDSFGEPIDGAGVYVVEGESLSIEEAPADAVTADGKFELPASTVAGAVVHLAATRDGYGLGHVLVRAPFGDEPLETPIVIRLDPLPAFDLSVRDGDTGEALGGVEVSVRDYSSGVDRVVVVHSNERGVACVPDLAARSPHDAVVTLRHEGYRPIRGFAYREPGSVAWEYRDEVSLFRGDAPRIRVVDRTGAPVARVDVEGFAGASRRFALDAELRPFGTPLSLGSGTTDDRGEGQIECAEIRATMYVRAMAATRVGMVRVREGEPSYEVPLHPACRVEGRVVDANGNGLDRYGIELHLAGLDGFEPRIVTVTGTDGGYRFDLVPFPDVTRSHRLVLSSLHDSSAEAVEIRYAEGGYRADPLVVPDASTSTEASVRIVDESGRGVVGARLGHGWLGSSVEGGIVTLRGLERYDAPVVSLSAAGFEGQVLRTDELRALVASRGPRDEPPAIVVKRSDHESVARVLTRSGQPLAAWVRVLSDDPLEGVSFGDVFTDTSGTFRYQGLPPGPCVVKVRAVGRAGTEECFRVDELDGAILRITDPDDESRISATVAGDVIGVDGEQCSRYEVQLFGKTTLSPDRTGVRFRFDDVPPGAYEMVATAKEREVGGAMRRPGAVIRNVTIAPGESVELELRLAPLGTVEGTIRIDGDPINGRFWLGFRRLDAEGNPVLRPGAMSSVGTDGSSFRMDLAAGTYAVLIPPNMSADVTPRTIEVVAGRTTDAIFEITRHEDR